MVRAIRAAVTPVALSLASLAAAPLALAGPVTTATVTEVQHGACSFKATIAWPATANMTGAIVGINKDGTTLTYKENDSLTPNKAGKMSITYRGTASASSHDFSPYGMWWDGTWHTISGNNIAANCS